MKPMLRYELCKLFARPSGKAALLLLAVLVAVSTFFACHVRYTDEEGQTQYGLSAVRQLRADQKAWAGPLDEAQLRRAIQANLMCGPPPTPSPRTSSGRTWPFTGSRPLRQFGTC